MTSTWPPQSLAANNVDEIINECELLEVSPDRGNGKQFIPVSFQSIFLDIIYGNAFFSADILSTFIGNAKGRGTCGSAVQWRIRPCLTRLASLERQQSPLAPFGLVESRCCHVGIGPEYHLARTITYSSQSSSSFEFLCHGGWNRLPQANISHFPKTSPAVFEPVEFFHTCRIRKFLQGTRCWLGTGDEGSILVCKSQRVWVRRESKPH